MLVGEEEADELTEVVVVDGVVVRYGDSMAVAEIYTSGIDSSAMEKDSLATASCKARARSCNWLQVSPFSTKR